MVQGRAMRKLSKKLRLNQVQTVKENRRFCSVPGEIRTHDPLLRRQQSTLKQLNKLSVSQLAELSNLSKAYISQVKHGKCPPSQRLLACPVILILSVEPLPVY